MANAGTVARTDWPVVATLIAGAVIGACQIGKVPSALPAVSLEFGLTLPQGAAIISLFNALGMLVGMACGALGDRLGYRRAAFAGFAAMAAGGLLGATAQGYAVLLASRALEGFGFIVAVATTVPLIVRHSARRHQRLILGIYGGYWPAGVALMIVATPVLLDAVGWRGLWLANVALVAGYALVFAGATRRPPVAAAQSPRGGSYLQTVIGAMRSPGALVLMALFAAYSAVHGTLVTLLPSYFLAGGRNDLVAASALTAIVATVNIGGNVLGGIGLHIGLPRWLLIAATFVLLGVGAFWVYDPELDWTLRLGAAIGLSFVAGIVPAAILAGVPVLAASPTHVGTTSGMTLQGSQVGQFVGPWLAASLVVAAGGWQGAGWMIAGAAVLGFVLALILRSLERTRRPA